jgi:tetratricopeptide (TPR) repeat protein
MYLRLKEIDKAELLLRRAALEAPDLPVYRQLAEVSLSRGRDIDGFLDTWNRYFQRAEDAPQDAALVKFRIAYRLMQLNEFTRSLPYLEAAMPTRASLASGAYLLALTRAQEYDRAERHARAGSYMGATRHYNWCRETGRGDLASATQRFRDLVVSQATVGNAMTKVDIGVFYLLESDPQQAARLFESAVDTDDGCAAHLLALVRWEQGQPDLARQILQKRAKAPRSDVKSQSYILIAEQLDKSIADPQFKFNLPAEEPDLGNPTRAPTLGNVFYLAGKACEMRGQPEAAKQWYRKSLDSLSGNFATRPLSAIGLRKLGEEYYK